MYRLRIDLTYTSVNNANTAMSNINNVMSSQGLAERATRSGSTVSMVVESAGDEATATSLLNNLNSAWGSTARSGGKVSLVKKPVE